MTVDLSNASEQVQGPSDPHGNFAFRAITANARRTPERIAVSYADEVSITYGELDRRVARTANALLSAGIEPKTRTATLLGDVLNVVDIYMAESLIGTTVAAINPYWSEEVIVAVTKRSNATAFVYDSAFAELINRIRHDLPEIGVWVAADGHRLKNADTNAGEGSFEPIDLQALLDTASDTAPSPGAHFDDEWMLLYTSGTTGLPKAVQHTHASGIAAANIWTDLPRSPDSAIGAGPIIWGSGFPTVAGTCFFGGMRLVLDNDFAPKSAIHVIERERVSHIMVLPSFWTEIFADEDHRSVDLSSLEVVLLGSEPIAPSLVERIKERIPEVQLFTFYGSAEAPYTTIGRLDDGSQSLRQAGRARAGCAVKVLNEHGEAVYDTLGTLCHAGPHLFSGYVNQPDATEVALRDGWHVGEDLGVLATDGLVTVLGRKADSMRRAGQWIHPSQVEEGALSHPSVADAGAVGVPADAESQRVLLAVAPKVGQEGLTEEEVWAHLRKSLSAELLPDAVVVAPELPHNQQAAAGTGKLLRREIRQRWGDKLAVS